MKKLSDLSIRLVEIILLRRLGRKEQIPIRETKLHQPYTCHSSYDAGSFFWKYGTLSLLFLNAVTKILIQQKSLVKIGLDITFEHRSKWIINSRTLSESLSTIGIHLQTFFKQKHGLNPRSLLSIKKLPRLKRLRLNDCRGLSNITLDQLLKNVPFLQCFNVDSVFSASDETLKNISIHSKDLRYLVIKCRGDSTITDAGIRPLAYNLNDLCHLDIFGSELQLSESLEILNNNCKNLTTLKLHKLSMKLNHEFHFDQLKICELPQPRNVDKKSLCHLIFGLKQIKSVTLDGCESVDDDVLSVIGDTCHSLENASFRRCKNILDKGLQNLALGCKYLLFINLSGCIRITDTAIKILMEECAYLQSLNLQDCHLITDKAIESLSRDGKKLSGLNVNKCVKLTDNAVECLAYYALNLKELWAYGCFNLKEYSCLIQNRDPKSAARFVHRLRTYLNLKAKHDKNTKLALPKLNSSMVETMF